MILVLMKLILMLFVEVLKIITRGNKHLDVLHKRWEDIVSRGLFTMFPICSLNPFLHPMFDKLCSLSDIINLFPMYNFVTFSTNLQ